MEGRSKEDGRRAERRGQREEADCGEARPSGGGGQGEEEEEEEEEPVARAPRKKPEPRPKKSNAKFDLPSVSVLAAPKASDRQPLSKAELEANSRALEGVLGDFGVRGEIVKASPGPVVTLYELEPAPGTPAILRRSSVRSSLTFRSNFNREASVFNRRAYRIVEQAMYWRVAKRDALPIFAVQLVHYVACELGDVDDFRSLLARDALSAFLVVEPVHKPCERYADHDFFAFDCC
jgi:hypothetical protein